MSDSIVEVLQARGFVHQMTETGLPETARNEQLTVYAGFDPTADSLHLGHVVPLTALSHFQRAGHRVIVLVGGATGMIGDPSGKSGERTLMSREQVARNVESLNAQIARFVRFDGDNPAILVDNADWLLSIPVVDFLRDVGKHFSIGTMLARDSVRCRLEGDGISFTEFTYILLQAFDFLHLFDAHGCTLQVGGSDQWGNIIAGLDLVRRVRGASVHGLTFPLITTASGQKFGKSERGALWLDPARTSPFELFQFWMNVEDADVGRFLRLFTFLSLDSIEQIEAEHRLDPSARVAHRVLAFEFTSLVHGESVARAVDRASRVLFGDPLMEVGAVEMDAATLGHLVGAAPVVRIDGSDLEAGLPLVDVLVTSGLAPSRGVARKLIAQGGVYINNHRRGDVSDTLRRTDVCMGSAIVVRAGKKTHRVLLVSGKLAS